MISVSLCMIVKNESASLARCLNSVKDQVDEIVIVDTGSTDNTKEIAREFTAEIFDFPWIDDFAAARNFSFSKATQDYILWLDADDIISEINQRNFLDLKTNFDTTIDSVTMHYHLAFDDRGNPTASLRRNRLVKGRKNFQWVGAVHEYLEVSGSIFDSEIAIIHDKIKTPDLNRNLAIYEARLAKGERFSPRDLYYFANELTDHGQYKKAIRYYKKFLATGQGWLEDCLGACGKVSDCYKALGDRSNTLKYILQSFKYDSPRAEFCCRLGWHFMEEGKIHQAIFWYKLATELKEPMNWAFKNIPCSTWLPHLQLCVCYDRLGEYQLANNHNELAAKYIPEDSRVNHNRDYFKQRLK